MIDQIPGERGLVHAVTSLVRADLGEGLDTDGQLAACGAWQLRGRASGFEYPLMLAGAASINGYPTLYVGEALRQRIWVSGSLRTSLNPLYVGEALRPNMWEVRAHIAMS